MDLDLGSTGPAGSSGCSTRRARRPRRWTLLAALTAMAVTAMACSGDDSTASIVPDPKTAPIGSESGPCEPNLVIQTDWYAQVEQGGFYQLIGPGGTADAEQLSYKGPLRNRYKGAHGVQTVEIRSGGGAIDNRTVLEVMDEDHTIDIGLVSTDDTIVAVGQGQQVTAILSGLDISPQMLMWSPARYRITNFDDLAETGAPVLHFPGVTFIEYLISKGYITAEQADASYSGDPSRWLESNGDVIQQGFATNEVYTYTDDLEGWKHPVDFFLIHWMGFENYISAATVRDELIEDPQQRECLELLVPSLQQAWVDFLADPMPVSDTVISVLDAYDTFFKVSEGLNRRAIEMFSQFELATNGSDDTYGNFDVGRMNRLYDIVVDVFEQRGTPLDATMRPADAFTNDFIDPSIGLPPS